MKTLSALRLLNAPGRISLDNVKTNKQKTKKKHIFLNKIT